MTKMIHDYPAAISIDASADYLLIDPASSGVYKKINRNILLGLSSAPIGTTDSQSPTNKTFDNTNIFTIRDDRFTLQDSGGTTRQAVFELSSITAGQTRILTIPDASLTIVGTATTQTLTFKTLISPTITGGTIANSTITVDSIAGFSSSTIVTVANLQISNGVLNSANAVTATSIAAGAVQPQALVTGTGTGWAWQTYTPTWTNCNIAASNGTQTNKYIQIGKTVFAKGVITFGTTTTVTGSVSFTLPVTSTTVLGSANNPPIGTATFFNAATTINYGWVAHGSTTTGLMQVMGAAATYVNQTNLSSTIPFTWATSYELHYWICYEAA